MGLIDVLPGQQLPETVEMLQDLGVRNIKVDYSRGVGRAQSEGSQCDVDQLCGSCGFRKAAIDCDGDVFPCVFSRWLCAGNVLCDSLKDVLLGKRMLDTQQDLDAQFTLDLQEGPPRHRLFLVRHLRQKNADPPAILPCGPQCGPLRCWPKVSNCRPLSCPPRPCTPTISSPLMRSRRLFMRYLVSDRTDPPQYRFQGRNRS